MELPKNAVEMEGMLVEIRPAHISEIRVGDTIMLEGRLKTVCAGNIKRNTFCGKTIFGNYYALGTELVPKAIIYKATRNGFVESR